MGVNFSLVSAWLRSDIRATYVRTYVRSTLVYHVSPTFLARLIRCKLAVMEELFSKSLPVVFKQADRDEK